MLLVSIGLKQLTQFGELSFLRDIVKMEKRQLEDCDMKRIIA